MLKLTKITKDYKVADMTVHALKGLSLCFRENEFVSVLGPSGCGKTTLLNIIGGLDKYTSGDMTISGRSTKEFKDRDWDVYRNHRIGFVFQSYNLIPHQTIVGNVELALTISGMSKSERLAKAKAALDKVGLEGQYYKRPNQLSGGQCQRVAIARALVNDPEILLADEPTGALDTKTSKQIMNLIKEIAKERLVIMVTHNPELADEYSTRIICLLDGELQSDSNPFSEEDEKEATIEILARIKKQEKEYYDAAIAAGKKGSIKKERAKMSFFTAFKLSLQNLFTKKKRTIMTSVAGAIGIIGVSLVLSISYGLQGYINTMQNDMLSGNPIEITEQAFDINAMISGNGIEQRKFLKEHGWVNVDSMMEDLVQQAERMGNMFIENTITQDYHEYIKDIPAEYLSSTMFDYGLDVSNSIYTNFTGGNNVETNISLTGIRSVYGSILGEIDEVKEYAPLIETVAQSFVQAPDTRIQKSEDYILSQYDLLSNENITSKIAKNKDEVMIVLGKDRKLADLLLAQLGYFSQEEFINIVNKAANNDYNKSLFEETTRIKYENLVGKSFKWYPNDSIFKVADATDLPIPVDGVIHANTGTVKYDPYYNGDDGLELKIVGILEPKEKLSYGMLENGFYYTTAFAEYAVEQNWNSDIAKELRKIGESERSSYTSMSTFIPAGTSVGVGSPLPVSTVLYSGITFKYFYSLDSVVQKPAFGLVGSSNQMSAILGMLGLSGGANNEIQVLATTNFTTQQLGGKIVATVETDADGKLIDWQAEVVDGDIYPLANRIAIYPTDFNQKEKVLNHLDAWNGDGIIETNGKVLNATDREKITYTDMLSLIIGMIQSLVQIITIALVGFTSLALLVSCVMIGIITYVSVVERIKEIGVIRSLGGRKKDVSNLFIAETFIIGFTSGMIGIGVTYLFSAIINLIVGNVADISSIAVFPINYALIMLSLSILLTLISGLMPSRSAAKKDPVVALRTE